MKINQKTLKADIKYTALNLRDLKYNILRRAHTPTVELVTKWAQRTVEEEKRRMTTLCTLQAHLRGIQHAGRMSLDQQAEFLTQNKEFWDSHVIE